jgi:hypothetical protein
MDNLTDEEILRKIIRRSLKPLRLQALEALLRIIRYSEEGKTPMAIAAEDLTEDYKVKAIFTSAAKLRSKGVKTDRES